MYQFWGLIKIGQLKKWNAPIAGIGQGNGVGLKIWVAVSTPLLELMVMDKFFASIICAMSLG